MNALKSFWNDEEGATAIEYGLIAGLISVGLVAALTQLGDSLAGLFGRVKAALDTAVVKPK